MPFALCAMGLVVCVLSACRKDSDEVSSELQAIVAERAPLAERMKVLVKEHGEDLSKLQQVPEWNELHKKVAELNAKYELVHQRHLRTMRKRVTPKGKDISK